MNMGNSPAPKFRLSQDAFNRPEDNSIDAKRIIFISTEGTETEPNYFGFLDAYIRKNHRECPYAIHVLGHNRDTKSSPEQVLALLEECRSIRNDEVVFRNIAKQSSRILKEDQVRVFFSDPDRLSKKKRDEIHSAITKLGINIDYYRYLRTIGSRNNQNGDVFAVVIDRDPQAQESRTKKDLSTILSACQKRNIEFCLSNPCFELWLILHFDYRLTAKTREQLRVNDCTSKDHTFTSRLLSRLAGHKKKINETKFLRLYLPKTKKALNKAKNLATSETDVLDKIGTRVPIIIERFADYLK